MQLYGLVGRTLGHSFSQRHFREKFARERIGGVDYVNFELASIAEFPDLLRDHPALRGLNVTIPYKRAVIPYLASVDSIARDLGAVNTIRLGPAGPAGFNTDVVGFRDSLTPFRTRLPTAAPALILGTGGASAAVAYVLDELEQSYCYVSRDPTPGQLAYGQLAGLDWAAPRVIVNTTPLGTHPRVEQVPDVPTGRFGQQHLVYDLVYNPPETRLLREAGARGAQTCNGLPMLVGQAEAAWRLWRAPARPDRE